MNLECELAATKSRFAHECDDVDRIMATLGIMTPRTECGSLRVNDIMRHIQETLDALAASHSASVAFSDKYAKAQRELAAHKTVLRNLLTAIERSVCHGSGAEQDAARELLAANAQGERRTE